MLNSTYQEDTSPDEASRARFAAAVRKEGQTVKGMVELVVDSKSVLGEGPCWDAQKQILYWVDGLGKKIHIYDPQKNTNRTIDAGQTVGCIVLRKAGGAVVALQEGIYFLDLTTEKLTPVVDPESHLPNNRFNDGKCDCAGRFWVGTMSRDEDEGKGDSPPAGTLYCMDTDLSIRAVFGKVSISNGLGWSPDNTIMYYIDSRTKQVAAFDYCPESGNITNKRVAVEIPGGGGIPDGMTVDEEGMLWVAQWGAYQVSRWDPDAGRLLQEIPVPASNVTCCAFGGSELDELYITTSRIGVTADNVSQQRHAGGLFRARPGVRGSEAFRFGG